MEARKRKALGAVGWQFGDAADFLGMSDQERQLLDARVAEALAVRRQRVDTMNLDSMGGLREVADKDGKPIA